MTNLVHSGHVHANGIRQHLLQYRASSVHGELPAVVLLPEITSPAVTWGFACDIAEMHQTVPQLVHQSVAGAGHMIPWDDEEGFYISLGDFLGATIPPRRSGHPTNQ